MAGTEFEIKLEIPAQALGGVRAALGAFACETKRLQAHYFDTDDGALARHSIAVRVRREGEAWVQTAKSAGEGALHRNEHNVDLAPAPGATPDAARGAAPKSAVDAAPAVWLARHEGTAVGEAIAKALHADSLEEAPPLLRVFETDVERTACRVRNGADEVEIAFDLGRVEANGRRAGIRELEFESVEGDPAAVLAMAAQWLVEHGLWISTVSKAERGRRLAQGQAFGAPVKARPAVLPDHDPACTFLRGAVHDCIEQILANASDVAAGSQEAEHIHQLRVGLRRLRVALRELHALDATLPVETEDAIAQAFRALGRHRDRQHLVEVTQAQLEAEGAPRIAADAWPAPPDPATVVRGRDFQLALLQLLAWLHAKPLDVPAVRKSDVRELLVQRLAKLHQRVCKDGARFVMLDAPARHRVRKRLKRLRYLAEFARPWFKGRRVDEFLEAIEPAQDALGEYNDAATAGDAYEALAQKEPAAWFGAGWLKARDAQGAQQCERALKVFAKTKMFCK